MSKRNINNNMLNYKPVYYYIQGSDFAYLMRSC